MLNSSHKQAFNNIPPELRDLPQWVCHRDKIPHDPKTGKRAACNKPATWSTFQTAQKAYSNGGYDGIGFVFTPDDPYVGIDLDHCVDDMHQIKPWAQELVEQLDSYTEFSPSGSGLHIILKASKPGKQCRGGYKGEDVEMYSEARYFTFTGHSLNTPPKPIVERQAELDKLYKAVFGNNDQPELAPTLKTTPLHLTNEHLTDDQVIELASAAKNGKKFQRLWDGDKSLWQGSNREYNSQSEADLALCAMLVFHVGDNPKRVDNLFRQSKLMRKKWERRVGQGMLYGQRTIQKAIEAAQKSGDQVFEFSRPATPDKQTAPPGATRADLMLPAADFVAADLPERKIILAPWLLEQSIIMIAGWRGVGKSWAVMSLLGAVVKGESFGPWQVMNTVPCAYLDGEMTPQDTKERMQALGLTDADHLYIYSDAHANFQGVPRINLLDRTCQQELKEILQSNGIKLWAIDNLGALCLTRMKTPARTDWSPVNDWLLELRFAGISTIVLHHVGKNNSQRGTSAHEDNLDASLLLKVPPGYKPEEGARFIVHFSKNRVHTDNPLLVSDVEFHLRKQSSGGVEWFWHHVEGQKKLEIIRMLDEDSLNQTDIAETIGVNKSYVTKIKGEAISEGLLTKKCRLTDKGREYVDGI